MHDAELRKILAAGAHFRPAGAIIAGGALTSVFTGQPINDIDMYFKTKADFVKAVRLAYDESLWCVFANERQVTFAHGDDVIQMMHFDWFPNPAAIFDAFDFTVCMAAYDFDSQEFVFHEDFLKHASQRYLKFHSGTRFPFGTLLRTIKYRERGYTLGKGDLLRIALCCHKIPLNSWEELTQAIGGQYGERVNLATDEPFSIDKAIELLANGEFTVKEAPKEMPGFANALLHKIGMLPESVIDDEDWLP